MGAPDRIMLPSADPMEASDRLLGWSSQEIRVLIFKTLNEWGLI